MRWALRLVPWVLCLVPWALGLGVAAAQSAAAFPWPEAARILTAVREDLWTPGLRGQTLAQIESAWPAWVAQHDAAIRSRVAQGDKDSVIHFLLFGTSFTVRPRVTTQQLATLTTAPQDAIAALRGRIDDFAAGLATPGGNERLQVAREVVARAGLDPASKDGRADVLRYLEARLIDLGKEGAASLAAMADGPPATTGTVFFERGLSTDTSLSANLGIERALQDLADRVIPAGAVTRVAIVGPGLDFVDKQRGYDFYPLQTIQPFALIDSLLRFGLSAPGKLQVTTFDLSPRVVAHLTVAREHAKAGQAYGIVLPRDLERAWTPALVDYWERMGHFIGDDVKPGVTAPATAGKVDVRALTVRPDVVQMVVPADLNIVTHRSRMTSDAERYELVVATNILLYYDVVEQSMAMANIASMLQPGGFLLTNNRLVELPDSPLTSVGFTDTVYVSLKGVGETGDRVYWYQRAIP